MILQDSPTPRTRRPVSQRSVIEAAKEAVPTMALAERLCGPGQVRKVGKEWVARCPLPDHDEKTPSFTVNPDRDLWFCHGCLRGGDVVRLARLAWGYPPKDEAMAAANLLHEFGHDAPSRPPSWFRKQERQEPARRALEEAELRHLQRRLFRRFVPLLREIGDEAERLEETELLWEAAGEIALIVLASRRAA